MCPHNSFAPDNMLATLQRWALFEPGKRGDDPHGYFSYPYYPVHPYIPTPPLWGALQAGACACLSLVRSGSISPQRVSMLRADGNVCTLAHHRLVRCSHVRVKAKDTRPSESSAACLSHIHPLPCRYLRIAPCTWPHMLAAPNGAGKNVAGSKQTLNASI